MKEEGPIDREYGMLQHQHPSVEGGAAEQATFFKVVPEAATPEEEGEEEEEVKLYQKDHPVKGAKTDGGGVICNDTHA